MTAVPRTATYLFLAAMSAVAWMTAPAAAAPEDRVVTFQVHEDPAAPDSPVRLTFTLQISAAAREGDAIGWRVRTLEVAEHGVDGTITRSWSDALEPTSDPAALWWVTHADPENPGPKEFLDVPKLEGTAAPRENTNTTLSYVLTSTGATDPSTGEKSARATYSLVTETHPEAPILGDDEPVETGGGTDPD